MVRAQYHQLFADKEQYRNRILATAKPANDKEYCVNKAQQVEQLDAVHLTEFEWARQTSKTWDMGQD
ncbi:hypothetical protein OBB00_00480 [Gammaproteobacteria bacterium]|nr:hypothetical protein [Gammaproteobacteria bacterium]